MNDKLLNPFIKFHDDWALVTSGTIDHFNTMTISWGEMGILWNKRVITIFIKDNRYTIWFLKENDYFTVSFYDEAYREQLGLLGNRSGRDVDKVKLAGFNPVPIGHAITFKEACQTFVCQKIYIKKMEYDDVPEFARGRFETPTNTHYIIIGEIIEEK